MIRSTTPTCTVAATAAVAVTACAVDAAGFARGALCWGGWWWIIGIVDGGGGGGGCGWMAV